MTDHTLWADINFHLLILFGGFFIGIFLLHIVLFSHTREQSHIVFAFYICALFGAVASIGDNMSMANGRDLIPQWLETIFLQLFHVGLIFFTVYILEINSFSKRIFRISLIVGGVVFVGMSVMFKGISAIPVASIFSVLAFLLTLYMAVISYGYKNSLAKSYLLAFLPLLTVASLHMLALNGMLGSVTDLSLLVAGGAMWNMTALSLLLSQKIKILQNERDAALTQSAINTNNLILQSRYASLGETVGNIAHQWKQPLNAIGAILGSIKFAILHPEKIPNDKLLGITDSGAELLKHLAGTIDTFYGFLTPKENPDERFCVAEQLSAVARIVEYSLDNSGIQLEVNMLADSQIQGNPNEFTHAILNIVLNARDAFDNVRTAEPKIKITVNSNNTNCIILVADNARGIMLSPPERVFEMNVSTKEGNSGIGLYMVKNIVEQRFGGFITATNGDDGAIFTIALPYKNNSAGIVIEERTSLQRIKQLTKQVLELEQREQNLQYWANCFEYVHWAIAIYTPDYNGFKSVNRAFKEMHGYTDEELRQLTAMDLLAPETQHEFLNIKSKTDNDGYGIFSIIHRRKDGSTFPATIETMVVKDENGIPLYIVANIWDRTEELKTKDHLQMMGVALSNTDEAVYLAETIKSNFIYVNDGACNMIGYTSEELLRMSVMDIDHIFSKEALADKFVNLQLNKYITFETIHRSKDGRLIPVEITSTFFERDAAVYLLSTVKDISVRKQCEEKIADTANKLSTLIATIPDLIWLKDPDGIYLACNPAFERFFGAKEEEIVSKTDYDFVERELADFFRQKDMEAIEKRAISINEETITYKDNGQIGFLETRKVSVYGLDGKLMGVLGIGRDITERKQYEERLKNKEMRLQEAQQLAKIGSWELKYPSLEVLVSDEALRIYELPPNEPVSYESFLAKFHPEDIEPIESSYRNAVANKTNCDINHRILFPDGRIKYIRTRTRVYHDDSGKILRSIGTIQDITEQKEAEQKIEFLTHHDTLTGLPNRLLAHYRTEQAIAVAKRDKTKIGVLFIDLDGFKAINDALGHFAGDTLLRNIAKRLQEYAMASDTLSRQGGDEFLLVLPITEVDDVINLACKIFESFESPFILSEKLLSISASMGIAIYPDDGDSFETLLQKADTAMYKAKELGRNTYCFYDEQMLDQKKG